MDHRAGVVADDDPAVPASRDIRRCNVRACRPDAVRPWLERTSATHRYSWWACLWRYARGRIRDHRLADGSPGPLPKDASRVVVGKSSVLARGVGTGEPGLGRAIGLVDVAAQLAFARGVAGV